MVTALEDCRVLNTVLNAIFLRVVPGKEKETLEEIDKKLGKNTKVYLGFGRYDLVLLREDKDFSLLNDFNKTGLEYVTEWFPVVGLKWALAKKKTRAFSNNTHVGLLSFSFVKIDPEHSARKNVGPIEDELKLIKKIRSRVPCSIYSSFGFNELIIVLEARDLDNLTHKLIRIKNCLVDDGIPNAFDICTIPAVDYRLWLQDHRAIETREKVESYLLLSLRVGLSKKFRRFLRKTVGDDKDLISIYGFHDTLVRISGTIGEVADKVIRIRSEGSRFGLYSTFTLLPHYDEALSFELPKLELREYEIPGDAIKAIPSIGREADQINFYRRLYQGLQRDPLTTHLFRGATFFSRVEKLIEDSRKIKETDIRRYQKFKQAIDNLQECLRLGFEQRCSGVIMGNLLAHRTATTEPYGSLQRIIIAMESIPAFLLNKLGFSNWDGFCIYGFSSRFYLTRSGVINIPQRYRMVPEMWWGLFHETGHEASDQVEDEMKTNIMIEVYRIGSEVTGTDRNPRTLLELEILKEQILHFAKEIFAELFGFHFGFNDDWNLYVDDYWSYFPKEYEVDCEHVSRSVLVYLTFGPGKDLARDEITIERIDGCIEQIEKAIMKSIGKGIDYVVWSEVVDYVWAFLDMADLIRTYLIQKPVLHSVKNINEISTILTKGHIVKHNNPVEIYFALINNRSRHQCKCRFATILSLCNSGLVFEKDEKKKNGVSS